MVVFLHNPGDGRSPPTWPGNLSSHTEAAEQLYFLKKHAVGQPHQAFKSKRVRRFQKADTVNTRGVGPKTQCWC